MQLLMAVLADRSDLVDGKSSLIGLFQSVVAQTFPTTLHGVLAIRVAFEADAADRVRVTAALRRASADGSEDHGQIELDAFVPPASATQPLRGIDVTIDLEGTELPGPGLYTFEVTVDDRPVASVPLSAVRLAEAARA